MSLIEQLEELFQGTPEPQALAAVVEPLLKHAEAQPLNAVSPMKELLRWVASHAYYDEMYLLRELLAASTAAHQSMALALGTLLLAEKSLSDFSWLTQRMDNVWQPLIWKSCFERVRYVAGGLEQLATFCAPRSRPSDERTVREVLDAVFGIERELGRLMRMLQLAGAPENEANGKTSTTFVSSLDTFLLRALHRIDEFRHEPTKLAAEIRFLTRTVLTLGYTSAAATRLEELEARLEAPQRDLLNACFKAAVRIS